MENIEDILVNHEAEKRKKKKINSGDKGKNAERALCKLLSTRFNAPFERSIGSGNRHGQIKEMTASMKNVFIGDITAPENFAWVLESKSGYESSVDFHSIFIKGNATIDSFLEQVIADSVRSDKKPMLFYKRNNRPWLVFVPTKFLPNIEFEYKLVYRDWTGVALEKLLEAPDRFFFKETG